MWTNEYKELVNRNIGLLTEAQQETLHTSCFAVFGLGGLGGVVAEILARSGIGWLKIIDFDKFEPTNLNRQIFAFRNSLGRFKTDVTEEYLKQINPDIKIEKYLDIAPDNIDIMLKDAKIAVLAIDTVKPCVILSRAAKQHDIPLVEGWAIPFGNVRVFTKDTPGLEEVYGLPTAGRELSMIAEDEFKGLKLYVLSTLKKIDGVEAYYPQPAIDRIMKGEITSFAPIVWLTAVLMSLEAIKVVLKLGKIAYSPNFALYNPFKQEIP